MNFELTVGERMEKALRSQGIPFNVVAEVFGVSRQTISNWLHGRTQPNKIALEKWAEITDVPYLWLVDGVVPIDWKPRNPN